MPGWSRGGWPGTCGRGHFRLAIASGLAVVLLTALLVQSGCVAGPWGPLLQKTVRHRRDLALLHRSSDFCRRVVDPGDAGRGGGPDGAAGGPISRGCAAHGGGDGRLSGRECQTVRDTVAAPIEQQVSGVENMLYMSSQCTNDGSYTLTVTFKLGMDSDMAQVLVQNRVALAQPVIPSLVQRQGINVKKMSPNTMMIVNLISADGRYDNIFLSNYFTIQIKDELGRLRAWPISPTSASATTACAWLNPEKLASLGLERRRRGRRHQQPEPPGRRRADRPGAGAHRDSSSN